MQSLNEYEALLGNRVVGFRPQSAARVQGGFGVYPLLAVMAVALSLCVLVGCGGGGGGGGDDDNGILFQVEPFGGRYGIDGWMLAVIDLNSDGNPDIVTWNSVLFGNGDGTFQDEVSIDELGIVTDACCVRTIADFNSDGHPDLGKDDSVLLGNGDGTFQPEQRFGNLGSKVTVADLNLDGYPDLLSHTPPSVRLGNGDGTFQAKQRVHGAENLDTLADFNGDGYPDLLTRSDERLGGESVSVTTMQLGNGDGTFQAEQWINRGGVRAVADFNGDGYPDLLLTSFRDYSADSTLVQLGNGDGTFQPELERWRDTEALTAIERWEDGAALTTPDFNGDGYPDLLTWSLVQSGDDRVVAISVRLGNGDGTFQPEQHVLVGDDDVDKMWLRGVADFNNDGHLDLVINGESRDRHDYWLLLGYGDGTFQVERIFHRDVHYRDRVLRIADLNSDGLLDLVIDYQNAAFVFLLLAADLL